MMEKLTPLIFDPQARIFNQHGIYFESLKHLESIDIISFEPALGYTKLRLPKRIIAHYYGTPIFVDFPSDDVPKNAMQIGQAMLTSIGVELAPICGSQRIPGMSFAL